MSHFLSRPAVQRPRVACLLAISVCLLACFSVLQAQGAELSACESGFARAEVLGIVGRADRVRHSVVTATALDGVVEVSATDTGRSCAGTVLFSDGSRTPVTFRLGPRPDGGVRVELQMLELLPFCDSADVENELRHLLDGGPALSGSGLTVRALSGQRQVGATGKTRSCEGSAVLSDGSRHAVASVFTVEEKEIYLHASLPDMEATPEPAAIPVCAAESVQREMLQIVNGLDAIRPSSVTARALAEVQEVSASDAARSCVALTLMSDGSRAVIHYAFERGAGKIQVRLSIDILPLCDSAGAQADVLRFANSQDSLTAGGRKATSLNDGTEVEATAARRSCKGSLLISSGERYPLTYVTDRRGDSYVTSININTQ